MHLRPAVSDPMSFRKQSVSKIKDVDLMLKFPTPTLKTLRVEAATAVHHHDAGPRQLQYSPGYPPVCYSLLESAGLVCGPTNDKAKRTWMVGHLPERTQT